jgi:hypothetical protein
LILSKFQEDNFSMLKTEDKKLALKSMSSGAAQSGYYRNRAGSVINAGWSLPMIHSSGLHVETNANTPPCATRKWNKTVVGPLCWSMKQTPLAWGG